MRRSWNSPSKGDLVIREQRSPARARRDSVFVVTEWPRLETSAGPYQNYDRALTQARTLAALSGVEVWRELSPTPSRLDFENVTTG